jgi:hypothetical protein
LKGGLSPFDKTYHIATLHQEATRYQECLSTIQELSSQLTDDDKKARFHYMQGFCQQQLGNLKEALASFQVFIIIFLLL